MAALAIAGACLALIGTAPKVAVAGLAAALLALAVVMLVRDRRLVRLADRFEGLAGTSSRTGPAEARLGAVVLRLDERLTGLDQRLEQRHGLTGLPTREPLIARMGRDGRGTLAAITLGDFDRLCAFDPAMADRVLLGLAERIRRMLPADRLTAHVARATLAIWFGPEITPAAAAAALSAIDYALGDTVRDTVQDITPDIRHRSLPYDAEAESPDAAIARLIALFSVAAPAGGGTLDPRGDAVRDSYALEQDLRRATARGELSLAFQPLIDAAEMRVCGAEALLRWTHPERGIVPPGRFVPVMEEAGLAGEIGTWALNAALREARGWQAAGIEGLRVAVNVSGRQLDQGLLPRLIVRALRHHGLPPEALEIELTESVALDDAHDVARVFAELRAIGVRLAIDDFGTGFSSLSSLRRLTFDKIKIDREFVSDVATRRESQAICQAIIALGRGLGIAVLAEGVETGAEYAWLRRHGCRLFQGYHFAPPFDPAAFRHFVGDRETLAARLALDPTTQQRLILERLSA